MLELRKTPAASGGLTAIDRFATRFHELSCCSLHMPSDRNEKGRIIKIL